jgi:hypothetical protein
MLKEILKNDLTSYNLKFLSFLFTFATIFLFLFFVINLLFPTKIIILVEPEPFIEEFELNLDNSLKKSIYSFNLLKASIFDLAQFDKNKYIFLDELVDKKKNLVLTFSYQDLINLITQKLNQTKEERSIAKNTFQIINYSINDFDINNGKASLRLLIKVDTFLDLKNFQFIKNYKTLKELTDYLKTLPNVKEVEIKSYFPFFKTLPLTNFQIKTILE